MGDDVERDTGPAAATVSSGHRTRELQVMVNVVTAYQRIRIMLDAAALTIDTPVAWLGVVPHDRRVLELPRDEILDVRIAPTVFPSRLVVAVALGVLPRLVQLHVALAVACTLVAFLFLLLSVVASIRIDTTRGERHVVPVCWLERRAVRDLLEDLGGSGP